MHLHPFTDRQALAQALAREVSTRLQAAVEARGRASLVVSGGSTPKPFFEALSQHELPWSHVEVTLADERWVPPEDEASNEALVRGLLLQGPAAAARFVPLKSGAATPEAGQAQCQARLQAMARPFDAVILGMGDDGHTASLFPGAKALHAGLDTQNPNLCLAIDPPTAPHPRMSLTLSALLASRFLALHITGEGKKEVLEKARAAGPEEELPIRGVLREAEKLQVYWAP